MTSGKPKWIALYPYRKLIDGRDHLPLWVQLFEPNGELSKDEFIKKVKQIPYSPCIGPPSIDAAMYYFTHSLTHTIILLTNLL